MGHQKKVSYPTERYMRDVNGMPVFPANENLLIMITPENMAKAVPRDDQYCAIAEGVNRQMPCPWVSVGRSRTEIAMPHPLGVVKPGYGSTKWAVFRFLNSREAKELIIQADTGKLPKNQTVTVLLKPMKASLTPAIRKERNTQFRVPKGVADGRGKRDSTPDALTKMGVRTLTGHRA